MRRVTPLIVMLVTEIAAVMGLHLLPPPDDSFSATLRVVALAGAWWLLIGSVLCVVAYATGMRAALQASARVTPSPLRRRIERALAASIVAGTLVVGASPALADPPIDVEVPIDVEATIEEPVTPAPEPTPTPELPIADTPAAPVLAEVPLVVRTGRAGDPEATVEVSTGLPSTDQAGAPPVKSAATPSKNDRPSSSAATGRRGEATSPTATASPSVAPSTPEGAPAQTGSYVVVRGDNLWDIAVRHLAASTGRGPNELTNAEVVAYWVRLCDLNRPRLRSGDPSLIYSGETIELPPLS